jgi:hypothetical protein
VKADQHHPGKIDRMAGDKKQAETGASAPTYLPRGLNKRLAEVGHAAAKANAAFEARGRTGYGKRII